MPDCPSDADLDRYHAGELAEARKEEVRAHLASCCACAARNAELLAVQDDLVQQLRELNQANPTSAPAAARLPCGGATMTAYPLMHAETVGEQVGPYKLLEKRGEGGFGVVYLAEQQEPIRRRVALKIIKLGMDTREVVARFAAESQALALLEHPNVAKVYDAGATEQGRPYFVMEYVPGVAITEYCDRQKLHTNERLKLFVQVCEAVQHAHQNGIIHRDIKPSNVMVAVQGEHTQPKVIDFGVAKAIGHRLAAQTIHTQQGDLIGTPEYMSPEQAEMTGLNIDTRSDIYSLGVLLYELLVGRLPFDPVELRRGSLLDFQRRIRDLEPIKPSTRLRTLQTVSAADVAVIARDRGAEPRTLTRELRSDLDWIVMKALEKDRTRRYASASEFAADIQRHLCDEPILASPPSATYQLRKLVRRHRGLFMASGVVFLVLVAGSIVSTALFVRAERARDAERVQRENAEASTALAQREASKSQAVTGFLQAMLAATSPLAAGPDVTVRQILDQSARDIEAGVLASQPEVEAAVRTTLAQTYESLGLYAVAESHWRRVLDLLEELFGSDSTRVAQARDGLGRALYESGQFDAAKTEFERALHTLRAELGQEHLDVAAVEGNLARVLESQGDLDAAERLYRRVLDVERRSLGAAHERVGSTLSNLGCLLQYRGDYRTAEPLLREALAIFRTHFGDKHIRVAQTLNNLARNEQLAGNYAAAEALLRKALPILREAHQNHHPDVAICIDSLAQLVSFRGDLAEAERLQRESLAMLRKLHPNGHIHVAVALNNLGYLVQCGGALGEAEALYREGVAQYKQVLGDDHREVGWAEYNLAVMLQERGDVDEALMLFEDNLRICRLYATPDHPDTAAALAGLGGCLIQAERCADAEPILADSLRIRAAALPGHWLYFNSMSLLGEARLCLGRLEEAETLLVDAYEGLVVLPTAPKPRLREAVERLEGLYDVLERPDEASKWRTRLSELDGA